MILLVTQITVTHIFPQSGCEDVGDVHGLDLPLAAGLVQVEPLRVDACWARIMRKAVDATWTGHEPYLELT